MSFDFLFPLSLAASLAVPRSTRSRCRRLARTARSTLASRLRAITRVESTPPRRAPTAQVAAAAASPRRSQLAPALKVAQQRRPCCEAVGSHLKACCHFPAVSRKVCSAIEQMRSSLESCVQTVPERIRTCLSFKSCMQQVGTAPTDQLGEAKPNAPLSATYAIVASPID